MNMLQKILEKIKKNPIVFGFLGFVMIVIIIALALWAADTTKVASSTIDILVAPSVATVKVGGDTYENGKYDIQPGSYHVDISLDEFESYTSDITIEPGDNYELYITLEKAEGSVQWYADHPEEDSIYSSISDKNYEKDSQTFEERYPVVKVLPYRYSKFENNYTVYIEYRIDYATTEDGNIKLVISDVTSDNKERALQYIRDKGYNPDDYQIEYNYTPQEPPAKVSD